VTIKIKKASKYVLGLVISSYVIIILFFSYTQLQTNLELSKNLVLDKLNAVSMSVCAQIDPLEIQYLKSNYLSKDAIVKNSDDSVYQKLNLLLNEVSIKNKLNSPIYVSVFNKELGAFEFIVTSNDKPYFRHTFKKFPDEILDLYDEGGKVGPYFSENGQWLSAFASIKDKKGKTIGLLHADEEFSGFRKKAFYNFLKTSGISLVLSIAFFIIILIPLKKIMESAELSADLTDQNLKIISQKNHELNKAKEKIDEINSSLETLVEERTKNLIKTNKELDQFVYSASHNIRSPLSAILGLLDVSKEVTNLQEIKEYQSLISKSAQKMDLVIAEIIEYSKNNRVELIPQKINTEQKINQVIEDLIYNDKSSPFKFLIKQKIDSKRKESLFITDEFRFKMLLKNLISNAIAHCDNLKEQKTITIDCILLKEKLIVSIIDNGIGIEKSIQSKIFDLFFVGNPNSSGSGIGLYIVKEVLIKIRGSIKIDSELGKGTIVRVEIPELLDEN